jgi:alginate O-acetyltransferase complex protein AlgI
MSFVSVSFFIFFPLVTIAYFLTPYRWRWALLLVASSVFYMAFVPAYILVMLWLITVDYIVGIQIEKSEGVRRTHWFLLSIISLVGILFVFKYFNFFNANIQLLAEFLGWNYSLGLLTLALPLGLSFHTFQSLSYVVEIYRRKFSAEKHFGKYALYVLFYPQLVAGPIERPQHLLPQLHAAYDFDYDRVKMGLLRMVWGFFKKMVVADRLAIVVDHVFANPAAFDGPQLLLASVFFTLQLYFDFSAYCDIALGASQVMGFKLMENFNRPFYAQTVADFWRRWHISLSSWFRDYFFLPLAFAWRRLGFWGIPLATLLTFLVTGFWHGANWTYGIFGLMNGAYIVLGQLTGKYRERVAVSIGLSKVPRFHTGLKVCIVFCLFVSSCIFFRAEDAQTGWYVLTHLLSGFANVLHPDYVLQGLTAVGSSVKSFVFTIILVAFVLYGEHTKQGAWVWISQRSLVVRWLMYWALVTMIVTLNESTTSPFIYFQF